MRCPDCNKFRASDVNDSTVTVHAVTLDPLTGAIEVEIEVQQECEECGAPMASHEQTITLSMVEWAALADVDVDDVKRHLTHEVDPDEEHDLTVEEDGDISVDEVTKRGRRAGWTVGVDIRIMCQHDHGEESINVGNFTAYANCEVGDFEPM